MARWRWVWRRPDLASPRPRTPHPSCAHPGITNQARQSANAFYSSGLNLNAKFLWNRAGSGGAGNGEARYTAFSMDWRTAASPLHCVTRALVTTPPGTWVTSTRQSTPTLAEGGLIHAPWIRLRRLAT